MEVVIIAAALLFLIGKLLLIFLQKKVSRQEALYIERKYYGWIPIICFDLSVVYAPVMVSKTLYGLLLLIGLLQLLRSHYKKIKVVSISLGAVLILSALSFYIVTLSRNFILLTFFATALADICAYTFAKTSAHKHFLPRPLDHKTYEGVIGELTGPFLALLILSLISIIHISFFYLMVALLIGCGAVCGDLLNSLYKKSLEITTWGEILPGHGGVFDRFSSFYISYVLVVFFISIVRF